LPLSFGYVRQPRGSRKQFERRTTPRRLERSTEKARTQAEVEVFILDRIYESLPTPPFDENEKEKIARLAYQHIWQQSASGLSTGAAA
jgi:hypothetical protein